MPSVMWDFSFCTSPSWPPSFSRAGITCPHPRDGLDQLSPDTEPTAAGTQAPPQRWPTFSWA